MFETQDLINELLNRNITATSKTVSKNGIDRDALIIDTGTPVSPVIYLDLYSQYDVEEAADAIEQVLSRIPDASATINQQVDNIKNPDYILDNCYISLVPSDKVGDRINRKSHYDDISECIYYDIALPDGVGSIGITKDILEATSLDEDKLWAYALNNTYADSCIKSCREIQPFLPENAPFLILTNSKVTRGAGAILNSRLLREFAASMNVRHILAIPSSIHEWLIMPCFDPDDVETINAISELVDSINSENVPESEILGHKAYVIDTDTL